MALKVKAKRTRYPAIEDRYEVMETLGAGGFAKVKAAVHKITGEKVAIKIMDKIQLGDDLPRAAREISILKRLHHQHICQLYEVIETERMYYLILEYCSGGELFDYIVAKERLKEMEARSFFRQIVSAIRYIHSQGFCHRDLKPENLLLDENSNIKLIDFGLSAEPQSIEAPLGTLCGSPAYAAPELIKGGPYIGPEADAWSMGVLLYALLNGFLPFDDDHTPRLYDLIMKGVYDVPVWLSRESIRLLSQLLQTNPHQRLKVLDLLNHPWLIKNNTAAVDWASRINVTDMDEDCVGTMAWYYCRTEKEIEEKVQKWEYGPITSTYLILLKQKLSGRPPVIILPPTGSHVNGASKEDEDTESPPSTATVIRQSSVKGVPSPLEISARPAATTTSNGPHKEPKKDPQSVPKPAVPPRSKVNDGADNSEENVESPTPRRKKISLGIPIHPPEGEITNLHVVNKRIAEVKAVGFEMPKMHEPLMESPSMDQLSTEEPPARSILKEAKSIDEGLHELHKKRKSLQEPKAKVDKERSHSLQGGGTLISKIITAIRKPSKDHSYQQEQEPRRVKGHFSVSSTSIKPADEVMQELLLVLGNKKINFKRKNYSLRCQEVNRKGKAIEFELEICQLPDMDMVGIRRKRMKGDTWEYKKICDDIFKKAKL